MAIHINSSNSMHKNTNIVNGSSTGSIRTIGSATEDSSYTIGIHATAEGYGTKASGKYSHAEGYETVARIDSGIASFEGGPHAEGYRSIASGGYGSHAEGNATTSSGGYGSHSEGSGTTASGTASHAQGLGTSATGNNSHSEGISTTASGTASHAEGNLTVAKHYAQHVFGRMNIEDPSTSGIDSDGTYIEIVGNGNINNGIVTRSNARTLDWSGNEVLSGKLTVGASPTNNMDVTTKQYVDNAISAVVSLSYEIVQTLPQTGENGVIYLVPNSGSNPNIYDEYIYVNNSFEKIGTTEIDLSGYLQKSGGIMTGALTLASDPTENLQAATKQYVDNLISTKSTKPTLVKSVLDKDDWSQPHVIEIQPPVSGTYPDASTIASNVLFVGDVSNYTVSMSMLELAQLIEYKDGDTWRNLQYLQPYQDTSTNNWVVSIPKDTPLRVNNTGSSTMQVSDIYGQTTSVPGGSTCMITEGIPYPIDCSYSNSTLYVALDVSNITFKPLSDYTSTTTSTGVSYSTPSGSVIKVVNPLNREIAVVSDWQAAGMPASPNGVWYINRNLEYDLYFKFNENYSTYGETLMYGKMSEDLSDTYVYSFEEDYPSTSYDISVEPDGSMITKEQYSAWGDAQIVGNPDVNSIKALGDVPTVDIPIIVYVNEK